MPAYTDPNPALPLRRQLLTALGATCAGPVFAKTAATPRVEFADLMHRLMRPRGAVTRLPWDELNAWPVLWRTPGLTRLPRPQPGMPLMRLGDLVLLSGGQPVYRHSDRRPGVWMLAVYGSEQGAAEVSLGMAQLAHEGLLSLEMLKAHGFSVKPVCQSQWIQGDYVYLVAHAERSPMRVVETNSGGSGGSSVHLRLPYTPAAVRAAVCS